MQRDICFICMMFYILVQGPLRASLEPVAGNNTGPCAEIVEQGQYGPQCL